MLQRSLEHLEQALDSSICLEHCASKVVPRRAGDIRFHLEQARLLLERSRRAPGPNEEAPGRCPSWAGEPVGHGV